MKILFALLMLVVLVGCPTAMVSDKVVQGVNLYCGETFTARMMVRNTINDELADTGHSVEVRCSGDPD